MTHRGHKAQNGRILVNLFFAHIFIVLKATNLIWVPSKPHRNMYIHGDLEISRSKFCLRSMTCLVTQVGHIAHESMRLD